MSNACLTAVPRRNNSNTDRRVFVGGPIQYGLRPEGFDERLRRMIEFVVGEVKNRGYHVRSAHLAEEFGGAEELSPDVVTKRDHGWMAETDAYVAILPMGLDNTPFVSAGTCVELGWASWSGVPITVLWDEANQALYSHLVRGLHTVADVVYLDLRSCLADPAPLLSALELR